jgi:surface protein
MRPFITTWALPTNLTITIPTEGAGYDFVVEWGDGTTGKYAGSASHVYSGELVAGDEVQIAIRGMFPRLNCNNAATCKLPLHSVDQWGDISWRSFLQAFDGVTNLSILASDTPNLQNVTNMQEMFDGATNLTGNFSGWDTSRVTNFSYMFRSATNFNQSLNSWDTSSVTNMSYMFQTASTFNQPLSNWDVSKVTTMANMFTNAKHFNQDLSSWVLSSVTDMAEFLNGTNLSTFNYNALLDKRSQYTDAKNGIAFVANTAQWGGCPEVVTNAQLGIEGRARLTASVANG